MTSSPALITRCAHFPLGDMREQTIQPTAAREYVLERGWERTRWFRIKDFQVAMCTRGAGDT